MPGYLSLRLAFLLLCTWALLPSGSTLKAQEAGPNFAPGVLTTIDPHVEHEDTVSVHDIVELRGNKQLDRVPKLDTKSRTLYEMAEGVTFRRTVWCLELSFKPMRMLEVDIPQPTGKMQRKLVWYLVYRVRNTGVGLAPIEQEDGTFTSEPRVTDEVRFIPQFVLSSQDRDREGKRIRKSYLDRILPTAVEAIRRREIPSGELLNSAQISEKLLRAEAGREVGGLWGVAIWEDVDPQIDFFSVYVGGLTNAYDWQDSSQERSGRKFTRKELQLNFWRPGDAYAEDEREIRFGAAPGQGDLYGTGEGVAYRWLYR